MKHMKILIAGILFAFLTSSTLEALPKDFLDLLERANLSFQQTEGFEEVKIIKNEQMNYEYAIKHTKKNVEVRYAIRPLDKLIIEYNEKEKNKKEGDVSMHPNQFHPGLMQATVLNISGGQLPGVNVFDEKSVKQEFNADWGATTFFEVDKEFGQDYKYCMMVALHKDDVADVYYFYLFDNREDFQDLMMSAFHSLKFK